jgi:hypothetical protein
MILLRERPPLLETPFDEASHAFEPGKSANFRNSRLISPFAT